MPNAASPLSMLGTSRLSSSQNTSDQTTGASAPPPAYRATGNNTVVDAAPDVQDEIVNLTAAFETLSLPPGPANATADSCLAHLKLLFAIQSMKEDIGYTDGLFGLWDSLAGPLDDKTEKPIAEKLKDKQLHTLSQIREKRWALFVARAVERYEAWWRTFRGEPLREDDMMQEFTTTGYVRFTDPPPASPVMHWNEQMLPPLGKFVSQPECSPAD